MKLRLLILLMLALPWALRAQAPADATVPPAPATETAEAAITAEAPAGVAAGTATTLASEAVAPGDDAAAPEAAPGPSLGELFKSGGPLMWPILLCSVIMVAFIFERAVSLRQDYIFPEKLRAGLMKLAREGDVAKAMELCESNRSPFARLMLASLQRAGHDGFEMEAALEEAGARVLYDLRRNCKVLAVVADIAPLLGLMGTVTGMIKAFDVVARSGALGRTELLAEGISEALLTTAFGLIVAVPAAVCYHIYRAKAENLLRLMEDAALDILAALRAARNGAAG